MLSSLKHENLQNEKKIACCVVNEKKKKKKKKVKVKLGRCKKFDKAQSFHLVFRPFSYKVRFVILHETYNYI